MYEEAKAEQNTDRLRKVLEGEVVYSKAIDADQKAPEYT